MFGLPNDSSSGGMNYKKRKVIFPNDDNENNNNNNNDVVVTRTTTTTSMNSRGGGGGGFSPPGIGANLSFSPTTLLVGGGGDSITTSSSLLSTSSTSILRRSVVGRRTNIGTPSTSTTMTAAAATAASININYDGTEENILFYNTCAEYRTELMKELNETFSSNIQRLQQQVPSGTSYEDRYAFIESNGDVTKNKKIRHSNDNNKENNIDDAMEDDDVTSRRPVFLHQTLATDYLRNVYTIQKLYHCVVPTNIVTGKLGGEIIAMGSDEGNQCAYPNYNKITKNDNSTRSSMIMNTTNNGGDDDDDDDNNNDEVEERMVAPFVQTQFEVLRVQSSFKAVSAGGMHSVALSVDGTVYSWGSSDDGALGRPAIADRTTARLEQQHFASESEPGLVQRFITKDGSNENGTIIQVAAGDTHILFLSINGNVYQCGSYKDCDSGKFCIPNPRVLTQEELDELECEKSDQQKEDEALEPPSTKKKHPIDGCNKRPVHIVSIPGKVQQIFTRGALNAALLQDGSTLVTWGFGCKGELARTAKMSPPPPKDSSGNYEMGKVYMYDFSDPENEKPKYDLILNNFLTPKPVVWCDQSIRPKKQILNVACGPYHLLVTARDANDPSGRSLVYSSGINNYGQLGHGDIYVDRHELTIIESLADKDIVQVAAGDHHSLALDSTGTALYGFGRSDYGQLGIGEQKTGQSHPNPTLIQFPPINKTDTETNNNTNDIVPIYPILTQIAAGERHSLAVTVDHQIYTWGFNETCPTGHHPNIGGQDIVYPTLLNLNNYIGTKRTPYCHVYMASGGGQHSLLLCKRFCEASSTS